MKVELNIEVVREQEETEEKRNTDRETKDKARKRLRKTKKKQIKHTRQGQEKLRQALRLSVTAECHVLFCSLVDPGT